MKISINAYQKVHYSQEHKVTEAQWAQIKSMNEREMCAGDIGRLANFIDLTDVLEGDDFEDVEIDLLDDDGKKIDSWEGE